MPALNTESRSRHLAMRADLHKAYVAAGRLDGTVPYALSDVLGCQHVLLLFALELSLAWLLTAKISADIARLDKRNLDTVVE